MSHSATYGSDIEGAFRLLFNLFRKHGRTVVESKLIEIGLIPCTDEKQRVAKKIIVLVSQQYNVPESFVESRQRGRVSQAKLSAILLLRQYVGAEYRRVAWAFHVSESRVRTYVRVFEKGMYPEKIIDQSFLSNHEIVQRRVADFIEKNKKNNGKK